MDVCRINDLLFRFFNQKHKLIGRVNHVIIAGVRVTLLDNITAANDKQIDADGGMPTLVVSHC